MKKERDRVRIRPDFGGELVADYAHLNRVQTRYMDGAHPITVGVRPDDVIPWREGLDEAVWARLPLTVTTVEALGGETILYGRMGNTPDENPPAEGDGEDGRTIILKAPADFEAAPGDRLEAAVNLRKLHLFDRESGESISPRIPAENLCPCTVEEHVLSFAGQRFLLPPALCDRPQTTDSALLTLPSEAILLGTGTVRAHVEEIEVFDADTSPRTLYRLTVGDSTLFALEHALPRFGAGDTVPFDLDFSRLTIEGCGILPLPTENRLNGRFTKEREIDERDGSPTKGKRIYRFYIDVEDHPIAADEALCEKLVACKGSGIFRASLAYVIPARALRVVRFSQADPSDPSDGKNAFFGRVTEILDYGRVVYALISIGSQTLVAPYDGCRGDRVKIIPDQSQISVVDREAEIIIV
jgi:hypothetical protein